MFSEYCNSVSIAVIVLNKLPSRKSRIIICATKLCKLQPSIGEPQSRLQMYNGVLQNISESTVLRAMWDKYRKQFNYAKDVTFEMIINYLHEICQ